jgi:hypothetical protein
MAMTVRYIQAKNEEKRPSRRQETINWTKTTKEKTKEKMEDDHTDNEIKPNQDHTNPRQERHQTAAVYL